MANLQYVIERKTIFHLKLTLLIGIKTLSILFYVRHKTNLNILIYYSRKNFISVKKEIFILHLP